MSSTSTEATSSSPSTEDKKQPVCVLVLGMAGSGKSSVTRRLCMHLVSKKESFHTVNLDPAVKNLLFTPLIDIKDTVDYKEVMKKYGLGPNGAIVTSLNLFSTLFDDVLKIIAQRENELNTLIFDTPGQIEVFCWSASGSIIAGALASVYPTVIVYVIDIVRSANSLTFMSNMLQACSILYKYKLPFIIAFNKVDIVSSDFAFQWLSDYESFQEVVNKETAFSSSLTNSLCLGLEEFYKTIKACGVSATTGEGMDKLMELITEAAVEYEDYREEYKEQLKRRNDLKAKKVEENRTRLTSDMKGADTLKNVRQNIKSQTEVVISLTNEGSDSESEEELDEDDMDEKREGESFQNFIKERKNNQTDKILESKRKNDQ